MLALINLYALIRRDIKKKIRGLVLMLWRICVISEMEMKAIGVMKCLPSKWCAGLFSQKEPFGATCSYSIVYKKENCQPVTLNISLMLSYLRSDNEWIHDQSAALRKQNDYTSQCFRERFITLLRNPTIRLKRVFVCHCSHKRNASKRWRC